MGIRPSRLKAIPGSIPGFSGNLGSGFSQSAPALKSSRSQDPRLKGEKGSQSSDGGGASCQKILGLEPGILGSTPPKSNPQQEKGRSQVAENLGSNPGTYLALPLRTGRGQNDRRHWAAAARSARKQRDAVHLLWPWPWRDRTWLLPLTVNLTRLSPGTRPLDDDNLRGSLKHVRDQVAAELGLDDGDTARLRFTYAQARAAWGVRIEVLEASP